MSTRSRLRTVDLLDESLATLAERPGRSALTALGTVIGAGMLVAVLGLTTTASAQISARFDAFTATEVRITDARASDETDPGGPFPADADARVGALNGVEAAGVGWSPRIGQGRVSATPTGIGVALPVFAASAGYLDAAGLDISQGRAFDAFHDSTGQSVVMLGPAAASALGVGDVSTVPAVFVDGVPFTVVGIVGDAERAPSLLSAVVVPRGIAERVWGAPTIEEEAHLLATTQTGAAVQIAREAPLALRPDRPELLAAVPPPDPRSLRVGVDSDLAGLFLALAAVSLLVGALGIAGTTLVSVIERVPEIGLRRAVGATRRHVVTQILTESGMIATLGGIIGSTVGVLAVLAVCASQGWAPVLEPSTLLLGPAVGIAVGLLAGAYPAVRAGRVEPVLALRQ